MKVILDTNIVLDVLLDRKPFAGPAAQIFSLAERSKIRGMLCATTITTIDYLLSQALPGKDARQTLRNLLSLFEVAAVDRFVARLRNADAGAAAPQVGDAMPGFLLPDHAGHLVSLEDLLEKGPVALTLHRGHWCPYCRINITALAQAHQDVAKTGGQVVAILPDLQQFAEEFQAEAHAPFPVLSDVDNGYAAALNLLVWMGEEMTDLVRKLGIDLPSYQGNESWTFPIPATFVIGGDGRIKARFVDPDYRKRMPIETLLDALRNAC